MELMVNETLLAFQKVMVNAHNHHNLLKQWEDVIQYYKWVELDEKSSHHIHPVFIPIRITNLVIQKPMDST